MKVQRGIIGRSKNQDAVRHRPLMQKGFISTMAVVCQPRQPNPPGACVGETRSTWLKNAFSLQDRQKGTSLEGHNGRARTLVDGVLLRFERLARESATPLKPKIYWARRYRSCSHSLSGDGRGAHAWREEDIPGRSGHGRVCWDCTSSSSPAAARPLAGCHW